MQECENNKSCCDLGATFGVWLMRLWLGFRALISGVEKYAGQASTSSAVKVDGADNAYGLVEQGSRKIYSWELYHGVPTALYKKLSAEPFIPSFMLQIYDVVLGPLLIATGLMLLLGIATRCSLFVMGLVYVTLTFGLILMNESSGVAWLAIHVILVVMMLFTVKHNKLELTGRWKI